jgi:hypothetical protein
MSDIVFRLRRWLGLLPSDYDCYGCGVCQYPNGLGGDYKQDVFVDYAKLFGLVDENVKTLTGNHDNEQWCF